MTEGKIRYRIIGPDEWYKLEQIDWGGPIPPPLVSCAAVAETESGNVVGVLFAQMAIHMEPLSILPAHRGKVHYLHLVRELEKQLLANTDGNPVTYYVFTPNKEVGRLAQYNKMKMSDWRVWQKTIQGNGHKEGE